MSIGPSTTNRALAAILTGILPTNPGSATYVLTDEQQQALEEAATRIGENPDEDEDEDERAFSEGDRVVTRDAERRPGVVVWCEESHHGHEYADDVGVAFDDAQVPGEDQRVTRMVSVELLHDLTA